MKKLFQIFMTVPLVILVGCKGSGTDALLEDIDSYIWERPDSALAELQRLPKPTDARSLARFSLLYSMALDKNRIDTVDVGIIAPAVDYYEKHGSAQQKIQSLYYQGRFQLNAGQISDAAISFSLALQQVPKSKDLRSGGLLYMGMAEVYGRAGNFEKEREYILRGIDTFDCAGDMQRAALCKGRLAESYKKTGEWGKADSLYAAVMPLAANDSEAAPIILSQYAALKLLQSPKDPTGSLLLLYQLKSNHPSSVSLPDYGAYAYAEALLGSRKVCDSIVKRLSTVEVGRESVIPWLYLIADYSGDRDSALSYLQEYHDYEVKTKERLLSSSVSEAMKEYFLGKAIEGEQRTRIASLGLLSLLLVSSIFFLLLFFLYKRRREKECNDMSRLLDFYCETSRQLEEKRLMETEEMDKRIKGLDQERQVLEETVSAVGRQKELLGRKLEALRLKFMETYKDKFSAIGDLCTTYFQSMDRVDQKDIVFKKVQGYVSYISQDNLRHDRFVEEVNRDLDDILTHLEEDMPQLDKKDLRFLTYCIVGFKPEMISALMDLSISNVYTKKSRFKDRIRNLDSPYKETYLALL